MANPLRWLQNDDLAYVVQRLIEGLITLLLASLLSFVIIQLAPGSYLDTLQQNPKISPETIQQLKVQFGWINLGMGNIGVG